MTAGGIVTHDPLTKSFELPAAYAEALSRGLGGPSSIAGFYGHVAMLGKVEDRIVDHFRDGGGVSYETYEELWAGAESSYDLDKVDPMAVDHVLSLLPGMIERLGEGIDVADVGCGWGSALNLLARRFPASRFVGFELSEGSALRTARQVADQHGLTNVRFQQQDATTLDGAETFDLVLTLRRHPRSSAPRPGAEGYRPLAQARWCLRGRRHLRLDHAREQPRRSARRVQVQLVGDVLHDRISRLRRNGSRNDVGRGTGTDDDDRGRLQ